MLRAKAQTLIRRPTGQLYDLVASEFFQNYPRWSLEVMELELTSPGPVRIGTTGSQVRVDQGRRRESSFRVSRLEQRRRVAFQGLCSRFRVVYPLDRVSHKTCLKFLVEASRLEMRMRPFEKLIRLAGQDRVERLAHRPDTLIEAEVPSTY